MNPQIFREYDIRGIAETDLGDGEALLLGRALGTYFKAHGCRRLSLGRDCRLSSPRIRDRLSEGLVDCGLDLVDLGMIPTPLLYFALFELDVDGGVMITGSHNPADYNGLKVALGRDTLHGREIQEIGAIARKKKFARGAGQCHSHQILPDYLACLSSKLGRLSRPLKVVVDCGNGVASLVAPEVYRRIGCQVSELFCRPDGRFPNHHPDPTVTDNLQDLIQQVRATGSDLGIAFDGDGDRLGVVDDRGAIVWGDHLMILFSRQILEANPGATIIGEVKCSMNLYQDIARRGGEGIMWKAGHSLIKAKMRETGALLAGEMSGHIFFADRYFGFDDATYAGARLLEIISSLNQPVSQLLADVPPAYSTPELRVDIPEEVKFEIVRRAQQHFVARESVVSVDGVRIIFEDGWGLIRASNTQPALVLRFEARTQERLHQIRRSIEAVLEQITDQVTSDRGRSLETDP